LTESGQLSVWHHPSTGFLRSLPSQPLADFLTHKMLEGAIKRGNAPAFLLLLPHFAAPGLLRLATLAGRHGAAGCLEAVLGLEGAAELDLTTPLRAASINGRDAALEAMVRCRGKAVLTTGFDSCSPLELAAAAGHLSTVRLLLRLGDWATLERAGRGERARLDRLMPLEVTVLAGEMVNRGTQRKEVTMLGLLLHYGIGNEYSKPVSGQRLPPSVAGGARGGAQVGGRGQGDHGHPPPPPVPRLSAEGTGRLCGRGRNQPGRHRQLCRGGVHQALTHDSHMTIYILTLT
jgi:hypothetical protein